MDATEKPDRLSQPEVAALMASDRQVVQSFTIFKDDFWEQAGSHPCP